MCSKHLFPFFGRGDRASERANERAWGEQKMGRSREGASEKRENVCGKECSLFFRTRSQFCSLYELMDACYAG